MLRGLAFWWGVVQHKMFRFQPFVDWYVLEEARRMNRGLGFPFGMSVIILTLLLVLVFVLISVSFSWQECMFGMEINTLMASRSIL